MTQPTTWLQKAVPAYNRARPKNQVFQVYFFSSDDKAMNALEEMKKHRLVMTVVRVEKDPSRLEVVLKRRF